MTPTQEKKKKDAEEEEGKPKLSVFCVFPEKKKNKTAEALATNGSKSPG